MASSLLAPAEVDYPSSDGRPMAESDHQRTPLTYAVERLRQYFRDREDVYVSGNLLIYYEEGNPGASVAPDVFVVVGADRRDRSSYRLWEEPKGPDFALEITSRRTHREDQGKKRELYRRLEVREYWQYDPTSDYLQPALQGLVLEAEKYRRLPGTELADGTLALASDVLGLELRLTERGLRFHDPETGRELPDLAETDAAVEQAEQARQRAERGRGRAGAATGATIAAGCGAAPRAGSRRPQESGSASRGAGGIAAPGARRRPRARRVTRYSGLRPGMIRATAICRSGNAAGATLSPGR